MEDLECGFAGSYCEPKKNKCTCREEFEATNHIDKCGHRKLVFKRAGIQTFCKCLSSFNNNATIEIIVILN